MEREQIARVGELVAHARENVPYYARAFGDLGAGPLSMDRFRDLPILTRESLRLNRADLMSRPAPPRAPRRAEGEQLRFYWQARDRCD
jgi:phenylacetate-coenzyme A ligase PaaK-like adenylate-forming protein